MLVKNQKIIETHTIETKLRSQKISFYWSWCKIIETQRHYWSSRFLLNLSLWRPLGFPQKIPWTAVFCCCEFIQSFKLRTLAILKLVQKIDMQHWLATFQGEFQHSISTRFCWNLIKSVLKYISTQVLKNFNKTSVSTLSPFFNNCVESFQ